MSEYKNGWRVIFLLLLLVALSGPWYFDRISVPSPYACSSAVRLDDDFCGIPGSGLWIVLFAFGGVFNAAKALLAAPLDVVTWGRGFLFSLLLWLVLLPFLSILFVMWRAENRRRQLFHIVILGLGAVAAGIILGLVSFSRLHWALWGSWFYIGLALSMLLFESLALWEMRAANDG